MRDLRACAHLTQLISQGLLHALGNSDAPIKPDSPLTRFFERCRPLSPADRGHEVERDASLIEAHDQAAATGQTATPARGEEVEHHYFALVAHQGRLIELDGVKTAPVVHDAIAHGTDWLEVAARALRREIANAAPQDRDMFSIIAICASDKY